MSQPTSFPAIALAKTKFKSPHKQDLTFAKNEKIRVLSTAPKTEEEQDDDDEDDEDDQWYIGESLDGSRKGTFPGNFVEFTDEKPDEDDQAQQADVAGKEPIPSAPAQAEPTSATSTTAPEAEVAVKGGPESEPLPPGQVDAPSQDQPAPAAADKGATSPSERPAAQPAVQATTTASQTNIASIPSIPASNKPAPPPKIGTSLKDRIAAFSRPGDSSSDGAPPLLPRPAGSGGGGWKRPPPTPAGEKPLLPRGQFGAKPAGGAAGPTLGGRTVPTSTTGTAPRSPIESDTTSSQLQDPTSPGAADAPSTAGGAGGFSAADAKANIKMSLKERMAALQRGGGLVGRGGGDTASMSLLGGSIAGSATLD